ncbi:hypothetical protein MMC11_009106, partial [Xylographa trunciseda]|nr:hypothetical protein [Xylographa trunciseda]
MAPLIVASPVPTPAGPALAKRTEYAPLPLLRVAIKLTDLHSHSGTATVYDQNNYPGSCGITNPDSAIIVALGNKWMDNEYQSPFCGRTINVVNTGSPDGGVHGQGNTITATVQDTCESCQNDNLDFSVGAWNALTSNSEQSVVDVT